MECSVCSHTKPQAQFKVVTSKCRHPARTCHPCVARFLRVELTSKQATEFRCPEPACKLLLQPHEVSQFLETPLQHLLSQTQLKKCLQSMSDFYWCSKPDCGYGGLGDPQLSFFQCEKCSTRTCFRHGVVWHEGISCNDYDNDVQSTEDQANAGYIRAHTKPCPKCKVPTEKSEGCDKMQCSQCMQEYCWRCMADFKWIREEGNHRHRETCMHYFAWEGSNHSDADADADSDADAD